MSSFLGSGMNVQNVCSSGHSPVSQIVTHILCILSSTVSPALNSSAGDSLGPVVSQYPFHLSAFCAVSVKFSPVADWIHCRRGWNFRVIDLTIWKSCLEFPFELAAFNSTHMPSSCCCLSTQSCLCTSAFSSWYPFLSLPICFPLFPDCYESLIRYPFLFLFRLDAFNIWFKYNFSCGKIHDGSSWRF